MGCHSCISLVCSICVCYYYRSFPSNKLHSNTRMARTMEQNGNSLAGQPYFFCEWTGIVCLASGHYGQHPSPQKNVIVVLMFDRSHAWNLN